jgi:hypothetical protein
LIDSAGAVARDGAVTPTVTSGGTGVYTVTWDRSVATCGYVAAIFGTAGGEISASNPANPNAVTINTFDSTGAAAARGFTLAVVC